MKINTAIHVLARPREKSGKIKIIHPTDGKEHTFYSCVNDLTGDRMTWWDHHAPEIGHTVSELRKTFAKIRANAQVLECLGDF